MHSWDRGEVHHSDCIRDITMWSQEHIIKGLEVSLVYFNLSTSLESGLDFLLLLVVFHFRFWHKLSWLGAEKVISFAKCQVRDVVILSEKWRVLKYLFESHSLIKKRGVEMTLFSFHHNSNFPRLVPPALWRDPGHCAGSRRGKTERITHPGKTDAQCGVIVLSPHTHIHLFLPSEINVCGIAGVWEGDFFFYVRLELRCLAAGWATPF